MMFVPPFNPHFTPFPPMPLTPPPSQVHKLCQEAAPKLLDSLNPQLIIAIGGGGYVPARILRSFLKRPGSANIPIQAIGLSLYEKLSSDADVEEAGKTVTRTQWLDLSALGEMGSLVGKRILIVDEVDDTRTTLEYAVKELEKDVAVAREKFGGEEAQFSIFVLHVSFSLSFFRGWCRWFADGLGNRTRTRRRRGLFLTTCSTTDGTWLRAPWAMSGSATRGRRLISRSMMRMPRGKRPRVCRSKKARRGRERQDEIVLLNRRVEVGRLGMGWWWCGDGKRNGCCG